MWFAWISISESLKQHTQGIGRAVLLPKGFTGEDMRLQLTILVDQMQVLTGYWTMFY